LTPGLLLAFAKELASTAYYFEMLFGSAIAISLAHSHFGASTDMTTPKGFSRWRLDPKAVGNCPDKSPITLVNTNIGRHSNSHTQIERLLGCFVN
jgi:hypothetical protein